MKFKWKKSEKPKGLAAVSAGNRNWELHVVEGNVEDVIAWVYPIEVRGKITSWYVVVAAFKNIQHYNSFRTQTWTDPEKLKKELLASIKRKLAEIPTGGYMRLSWRRRKMEAGAKGELRHPIYWELWYEGPQGTNETWVAAVFPKCRQGEAPVWWVVVHPEHGLPEKNTQATKVWSDVEKLKNDVKGWVAKRIKPL